MVGLAEEVASSWGSGLTAVATLAKTVAPLIPAAERPLTTCWTMAVGIP